MRFLTATLITTLLLAATAKAAPIAYVDGGYFGIGHTEHQLVWALAGGKLDSLDPTWNKKVQVLALIPPSKWVPIVRQAYIAKFRHDEANATIMPPMPTEWIAYVRTIDGKHSYWLDAGLLEAPCLGGNLQNGPHAPISSCNR